MSKPKPLTEQEIRRSIQVLKDEHLKIMCHVQATQKALMKKGILTEEEISQAFQEVLAQNTKALADVRKALHPSPSKSVQ
jgi:hypothetical protein